jgi:GT2 family glycosyltransferase
MTLRVSVAVSTYQRAHLLPRLVRALEAQTLPYDEFELVITDNGSTDTTRETLQEIARTTSLNLRCERLDVNRGPAAGRNAAWRRASAPVVAFTDDDCIPQPTWLERGLAAVDAADIVVGFTQPDPAQESHRGPFSRSLYVGEARFFQTCNVFYRRGDLEATGGFDEGFKTPGGEDTDLGWRVADLGRTVAFGPDVVVHHDISPSDFRAKLRETWRWWSIPRIVARHPERGRGILHHRLFWRPSHPHVIAAIAGLAVAWRYPIALLATLPWLYLRTKRAPLDWGRVRRFVVLPGAFAIDALEVVVMIRGSIAFRALVL